MPTPSRDLAVPVPAPPSNFQPLHLRFVVLWVGGEDPSLRVPSQQLVDSYVTHVVHGDCMGLVRSLMGNLRPLWPRSSLHPQHPRAFSPPTSTLTPWPVQDCPVDLGGRWAQGRHWRLSCPHFRAGALFPLGPFLLLGKAQAVVSATSGA